MFIRMKEITRNDQPIVINLDINSFQNFYQDGNYVKLEQHEYVEKPKAKNSKNKDIEMIKLIDYTTMEFSSSTEAKDAVDRIFAKLGQKQPIGNVLDLTISAEKQEAEEVKKAEASKSTKEESAEKKVTEKKIESKEKE